MDLLSDIRQAVYDDLTIGAESTLYPPALVDRTINRSYRKATSSWRWSALEDALMTDAKAGHEYYDAPPNWQPDSMWMLMVDGETYGEKPDGSPLLLHDYLRWREQYPNSNEKKWTTQALRYFISPVPTADGSGNICIWGQKTATKLVLDTDVTIFSYSMPDCNEAIELETLAILQKKGDLMQTGQFASLEAKQILATAFNKTQQNKSKYEKNEPMFEVPDFFHRNRSGSGKDSNIGRF